MTKIELGDLEVGNYLVIVFRVEDNIFINPRKYQIKNNEHKNTHENMPQSKLLGNQHIIAYV
jgi:hypothetical protein